MHLQESGEMYLETIYVLSKNGVVRSLDVAEYMGFSKPSVSRAVGLLKQGGYQQDHGILPYAWNLIFQSNRAAIFSWTRTGI